MDLNNIVAAFATKLQAGIPGLQGDGYPMSPPEAPGFEIDFPPDGLIFNATAGNKTNDIECIVRLFCASADPDAGARLLYSWLSDGTQNVATILNADKTLGGTVDNLFVRSASVPIRVIIDNSLYLAAEWRVNLTVSPS